MDQVLFPMAFVLSQERMTNFSLTYMFPSRLYILNSSARLYSVNLHASNALRMHHVEAWGLVLVLGPLLDSFVDTFHGSSSTTSPPLVIGLDETSTLISSGPLKLQSGLKKPTVMPTFEHKMI